MKFLLTNILNYFLIITSIYKRSEKYSHFLTKLFPAKGFDKDNDVSYIRFINSPYKDFEVDGDWNIILLTSLQWRYGIEEELEWQKVFGGCYISHTSQGMGYTSIFQDSDFYLKPEVQQMTTYYDDLNMYADVAYENGIINEPEYNGLNGDVEDSVIYLRKRNKLVSEGFELDVISTVGSFIPYGEVIFDVLGNTVTPHAAGYGADALEKISKQDNMSNIVSAVARNNI